ncbi:MAG TPA: DUF1150 family protein [Devosia sp.]|jgi:hypothetical protein|nr:DUF1150 family protein [Devosia sp.]
MHNREEHTSSPDNPLRHLTAAQFMALGGNAVVYIRPISGRSLSEFMEDVDEGLAEEQFQLVVSADGQPLLVADSEEAVTEWLSDKNLGIVALH